MRTTGCLRVDGLVQESFRRHRRAARARGLGRARTLHTKPLAIRCNAGPEGCPLVTEGRGRAERVPSTASSGPKLARNVRGICNV
jgi:hypothetical protein